MIVTCNTSWSSPKRNTIGTPLTGPTVVEGHSYTLIKTYRHQGINWSIVQKDQGKLIHAPSECFN